jgi:flagellar hook protein FlgE
MLTSLYTGISGMNTNMNALTVVGNNISNLNTYGFKASRSIFSDIFSRSLSGLKGSGLGVTMSNVATSFTQGAFETTNNPLDLAIEGDGFFVLRNASGGEVYSRAGIFHVDKDGAVIDNNGLYLQGYQADAQGRILTEVNNLTITNTSYEPQSTTEVTLQANLGSDEEILLPFDLNSADDTSNFATGITMYDSLGNAHPVTVYFRKDSADPAGNDWEWFAVLDAEDAMSGTREIAGTGTLSFDSNGALQDVSADTAVLNFSGGAAQGQTVSFNFGTTIASGGEGRDGVTQYGELSSGIYSLRQDGYAPGKIQGISIEEDGTLVGTFTNGKSRALGQVVLANFPSLEGLTPLGKMLYAESPYSGAAVVGGAGTEGLGTVRSHTLELSNVDVATEFIRMITAQRGFQANSKVISTTDEVLMELVNLKR